MKKLIKTKKLEYPGKFHDGYMMIDEEHIHDMDFAYSTTEDILNVLKPLGRLYFDEYKNLNYTDGTPVERAVVSGGERGMIERYLRPGVRVYTEDMVVNIIKSKLYEQNNELKPKLPQEVADFLKEISNNQATDKPKRAKILLEKYNVIE